MEIWYRIFGSFKPAKVARVRSPDVFTDKGLHKFFIRIKSFYLNKQWKKKLWLLTVLVLLSRFCHFYFKLKLIFMYACVGILV